MHWTYAQERAVDRDCLQQGDILERKDELVQVLKQVHPHFADPKYVHFIVLTQSCDLYFRPMLWVGGSSSARWAGKATRVPSMVWMAGFAFPSPSITLASLWTG